MMQKALGDKTIGPEGAQVHPTSLPKPDDGKAKAKILEARSAWWSPRSRL